MRSYFKILLGQFHKHPLLGRYLDGITPDFENIYADVFNSLSSGEQVLVQIAHALYNGNPDAKIADLFILDNKQRVIALKAIEERMIRGA